MYWPLQIGHFQHVVRLSSSLEVEETDTNNPTNESCIPVLDAVLQALVDNDFLWIYRMTEKLLFDCVVGVPVLGWSAGFRPKSLFSNILHQFHEPLTHIF